MFKSNFIFPTSFFSIISLTSIFVFSFQNNVHSQMEGVSHHDIPIKLFRGTDGGDAIFQVGSYNDPMPDLTSICVYKNLFGNCDPSWNDQISSVLIESRSYNVSLWQDVGYRGRCITLGWNNGQVQNLRDFGFDEATSSFASGKRVGCEDHTSPQSTTSQNGVFIRNTLSSRCIDVAGAPGISKGSSLGLWDCETSGFNRDNGSPTDQKWMLTPEGFIKNTLSGRCIDVAGAPGTANGSRLGIWDCETSGFNRDNGSPTDQKWMLTPEGFIKNIYSGKCIDIGGAPGTTNGAPIQLWDCETSGFNRDNGTPTDQRWKLN
jgi:hypothetical protein